jgi:NADP-dependent alcohol dehydrogenase
MENFTYFNPTRIHFGRGQIAAVDRELPARSRVLLLAGCGSIRANGVYEQVRKAIGSRTLHEFFGVEPNPDFDTLMKAVEVARREKIDWIVAAGGGSVLDGAKFVAAAVPYPGDPWEILVTRGAGLQAALPVGTVLTLPGTGSEANGASVISRRSIRQKLAFIHPLAFPRFSVLDPETTFTLPERQISNGIGDAFTHVIEQYLTYPARAAMQDRFAESVMHVLIDEGPRSVKNPSDYDRRANVVWAATWALNGAIGAGVPQDWASHMIGHELTALHAIDHARTLAVVVPSLLDVQRAKKRSKLVQYAERVWGIDKGSDSARVDAAIDRTRAFY